MYSKIVVLLLSSALALKPSRADDEDLGNLSRKERDACQYSHFTASHSMCGTNFIGPELPLSQTDKIGIVIHHNRIRNEVNPPAASMHKMVWDDELALIALTYARQCPNGHDTSIQRAAFSLPGVSIGQNLYYNSERFDPVAGVLAWENEKAQFVYEGSNDRHAVGHYTEMILEKNAKVGCGIADCTASSLGRNIMVCNYGQFQLTAEVDKPYCAKSDGSCSTCGNTHELFVNLCDCAGKICFNGGAVDPSTCQCTCPTNFDNTILLGALCETLKCFKYSDGSTCSSGLCGAFGFSYAVAYCPRTCSVCPSTCALTCQNGGYLNYVNVGTATRCACYCPPGFSGEDCSSTTCSLTCGPNETPDAACTKCECTLHCNGHGTPKADCSDCTCDPNWGGTNCGSCTLSCGTNKEPDAACTTCVCKLDCNNHGTATSDCLMCICDPNWGGPKCSDCTLSCNGHGTHNPDCLTCTCDPNWGGDKCNTCTMTCPAGQIHNAGCTACVPASCTLTCQNGGVLDSAKCECSCSSRTYGTTCDKICTTEAIQVIRSRMDTICKASFTFSSFCQRTCKKCTGRFCTDRYRGFCRYIGRRNIIRGVNAFCSAFTKNECSRLCRRFG